MTGEADYIIGKAQKRDTLIVSLGSIVFFSTYTGDAWMLDSEDGLALCLARDAARQEYLILETALFALALCLGARKASYRVIPGDWRQGSC